MKSPVFADRPGAQALWDRLCAWSPDVSGAALPFSARLAAENGWSHARAWRVIEEYRRFMLMAVVSDDMVTPSDAVDQVWHLHLSYSRSYWEDFCPRVLMTRLHHEPTQGGASEDHRFEGTYRATLACYREFFGDPPSDLWPAPAQRFGARFRRVEVGRRWGLGRRVLRSLREMRWQIPWWLGCLAIAGCAGVFTERNTSGPSAAAFLNFYLTLEVCALGLILWLQETGLATQSSSGARSASDPDRYALACIARGQRGVLETVVTSLHQAGHLMPGSAEGQFSVLAPLPSSAHPVEAAFMSDVARGPLPKGGGRDFLEAVQAVRARLQADGLMPALAQTARVRKQTILITLLLFLLGGIRVAFGIGAHRPVGFLVLLMAVLAAVLPLLFYRTTLPNRHGREALARAKAALPPRHALRGAADAQLALYVALSGTSVLASAASQDLRRSIQLLAPKPHGGKGDGCGSGGCGGGGCGGGGCGG